ncbi:MAG: hypothetical protein O2955_02435 [Planctomycetota bacterium]|nr:hypothetical protein [Planctomycetota bacterium]MDA1211342.1 hypothetical protein [Planctomycetota bacterium]
MSSQVTNRIPLTSLYKSVEQTVKSGRLGTIVSLRVLMSTKSRPVEQLAIWLEWTGKLFDSSTGKLYASQDAGGRQISVLASLASGATISLTAVSYSSVDDEPANTLQLLLIGQHGIARLEGGNEIDPALASAEKTSNKWTAAIEKSVHSQAAIHVD